MQFHLYHNISLFRQHRSLEDCQQGIVMIREDLGRLYNPEDLPKDKLFKNTLKIDLRDLTKQVKDNLDEGVYLTGSVDWIFAYLFVNRAKIFLSMIATITFFFFSYFEPIYKVYHAFNYVIPNWEYIEKVVDKEKKKETSKSNSTKN